MDDKIIADIESNYGITLHGISLMEGGWLNQLWKASAGGCDLVIKRYSTKRFNKQKIIRMESALKRQAILESDGIACPHIYPCGGKMIRILDDDTVYMVMSFCQGKNINPESVTLTQMESIGSACAKLHKSFSKLPVCGDKTLPVFGGYTLDSLKKTFAEQKQSCSPSMPDEYRNAICSSEPIINQLATDFFAGLPKGISHEDFTPDNILLNQNTVAAVIDFDRSCYSYIWHDAGRAILSFALEQERLNPQKVQAFIDGYSKYLPFSPKNAADALRISWCIEMPWWIQPSCFTPSFHGKAVKYRDQILWLTKHWFEIDDFLCVK